MTSWVSAKVILRTEWAPGLVTLGFDVKPLFKPGQFLNLGLWLDGELVRRSYSVASAPGQSVEFYLNGVDTGRLSPRLSALKVNDAIEIETKAYGFFTLDYLPEARELWLVATGTGLGPFISMLRSDELMQRFERVVVVHGARIASHWGYREELDRLASAHPDRLSLVRVVSREPALPGALAGRIPDHFASGQIESIAGLSLDPTRSHVMLCGNPEMIRDASTVLERRGLKKHRQRVPGQITSENYW